MELEIVPSGSVNFGGEIRIYQNGALFQANQIVEGTLEGTTIKFKDNEGRYHSGTLQGGRLIGSISWDCYDCGSWGKFDLSNQVTVTEPLITEVPVTEPSVAISRDILAYYTLDGTDEDSSHNFPPINIGTGFFVENGVYCDGVEYSCIHTPPITTLNYHNFSISVDFKVEEYPPEYPKPVFVAGTQWRWIGFILYPTGAIGLLYNNAALMECPGQYNLNTWHNALVTYDGSNGSLYLDNNLICTVPFAIIANGGDADKDLSSSNYSNASAFKGYISNLRIYKMAITP